MSFDLWAILAVGGGLLATSWAYAKTALWRIVSLAVVRAKLEGNTGDALLFYCWRNMKRSPFGERRYSSFRGYVRPIGRYQVIGHEKLGSDALVFWLGWRPLVLSLFEGKAETPGANIGVNVTFLRGMFAMDTILIEAIKLYNLDKQEGEKNERFCIERKFGNGPRKYRGGDNNRPSRSLGGDAAEGAAELGGATICPEWRLLGWQRDQIGADKPKDPWDALAFPPEVVSLVEEIRRWETSEEWYKQKRIAWKRGVLFWGSPGTGKSSLAKAIAQELDLPIIAFDLTSFSNDDFVAAWRRLMSRVPCMVLLEDIDAVFDKRENKLGEDGGGLSFDCLLNCISGVESSDGVLVVVTTNKIEALDEALGVPNANGVSTRPGRIDRVIELLPLDSSCREKIAARILEDCPSEIARLVLEGEGESGAQFVERCSKVALEHYWNRPSRNGTTSHKPATQKDTHVIYLST